PARGSMNRRPMTSDVLLATTNAGTSGTTVVPIRCVNALTWFGEADDPVMSVLAAASQASLSHPFRARAMRIVMSGLNGVSFKPGTDFTILSVNGRLGSRHTRNWATS